MEPTPPPLPKQQRQYDEKTFVLTVALIIAVLTILSLIITLLRKCLNNNQSGSCTTPSSNQNPNTVEPPLTVISLITYDNNTAQVQPSSSFSSTEMFGHAICSICLGEYEIGDKVAVLRRCKHGFHEDCIRQWLPKRSVFCPVCRDPVMADFKPPSSSSVQLPSSAFVFGFGMQIHHRQLV